MKIILISLLVFVAASTKAQQQNSQASQVITMRLQPVSLIDLSAAGASQVSSANSKKDAAPASSMHVIIINKNLSQNAALPVSANSPIQNDAKNSYKSALAYSLNVSEPVYTFSSR